MNDPDQKIRAAAFMALEDLTLKGSGCVTWKDISRGFPFEGDVVYFASKSRGIFKPKQMTAALSIKTTVPRGNRKPWYDDQFLSSPDGSYQNFGLLRYELSRAGPKDYTNRALLEAWRLRAPLIYFAGVSVAVYQPYFPVWIEEFSMSESCVLISTDIPSFNVGSVESLTKPNLSRQIDPSYTPIVVSRRNHQKWFSARVRAAYGWRCAFSGLPVKDLLVGAHIVSDRDGGPPSVNNGICMSTLHHAAFDAYLVGIDPDYRVRVSSRLRNKTDGELMVALKGLDGTRLRHLPRNPGDWPNRDFLEQRYDQFLEQQGS